MKKKSEHYVDNAEFCDALTIHRNNIFSWKHEVTLLSNFFIPERYKTHSFIDVFFITTLYEYLIVILLNKPVISNFLVIQIQKIATRFAQRPIYINRTYKEDMINNGIENCLKYITNFDPSITKNPFSYFTTCCYYAYLRTILEEHKQRDIETKITAESEFSAFFASSEGLEYHEKQQLKEMLELRCRTESQLEHRLKNA